MKSLAIRALAFAAVGALAALLLLGAAAPAKPSAPQQTDKLIIISTSDVKGKTSPCG